MISLIAEMRSRCNRSASLSRTSHACTHVATHGGGGAGGQVERARRVVQTRGVRGEVARARGDGGEARGQQRRPAPHARAAQHRRLAQRLHAPTDHVAHAARRLVTPY